VSRGFEHERRRLQTKMMDKWRFYRLKEMKFCFPIIRRHEARLCVCVFVCIIKIGLAEGRRSATESQPEAPSTSSSSVIFSYIFFSGHCRQFLWYSPHSAEPTLLCPSRQFYLTLSHQAGVCASLGLMIFLCATNAAEISIAHSGPRRRLRKMGNWPICSGDKLWP
jgi:hypothetical protein